MDTLKRFINFIELSTKLASATPFFIGIAYVFYLTGRLSAFYTVFFAVDMILFDLPVTMINNYLDKRRAGETPHFSKKVSLTLIFSMTAVSAFMGLYLAYQFGLVLLIVGVLCFLTGIFYSFGPISISRTPYSEIVSGLVQGFSIIFLVTYINLPAGYLAEAHFDFAAFTLRIDFWHMLKLGFVTLPAIFCISNIMLANNICDVERDKREDRYSLPYYIGREKALMLFRWIYAAAYISILAGIVLGALPIACALTLAAGPLVRRNVSAFSHSPAKSQTFVLSIFNFGFILFPYIVTLFIGRFTA